MPLSKRNKVVRLTKVKRKKGDSAKQTRVEKLRKSILSFKFVYVFKHENMTTNPFRVVQAEWSDSKYLHSLTNICLTTIMIDFSLERTALCKSLLEENRKTNLLKIFTNSPKYTTHLSPNP